MKLLVAIVSLSLMGCGSFTQKTERLIQDSKTEATLQTTDKGNNSYSGDPVDHIVVTASGNGVINLAVGDKGKVNKNEKRDTATDEEISSSFSVDYYIKQIPTAGWALIIFLLIVAVIVYIIWTKTTMAGRAFDGATSEGLNLTREGIKKVMNQLAHETPGSQFHTSLLGELSELREREGSYLHRSDKRRL